VKTLLCLAYALLTLADYYLTRALVTPGSGVVVEGNPIAAQILTRWGWEGVGYFSLILLAVVLVCTVLVSWSRPRLGSTLLSFVVLIRAGVVAWGTFLLTR
jgi:hypothetical protein